MSVRVHSFFSKLDSVTDGDMSQLSFVFESEFVFSIILLLELSLF